MKRGLGRASCRSRLSFRMRRYIFNNGRARRRDSRIYKVIKKGEKVLEKVGGALVTGIRVSVYRAFVRVLRRGIWRIRARGVWSRPII